MVARASAPPRLMRSAPASASSATVTPRSGGASTFTCFLSAPVTTRTSSSVVSAGRVKHVGPRKDGGCGFRRLVREAVLKVGLTGRLTAAQRARQYSTASSRVTCHVVLRESLHRAGSQESKAAHLSDARLQGFWECGSDDQRD